MMNDEEIMRAVLGLNTTYQGIFNLNELLNMIDSFFRKKGYTKHVISHEETRQKKGKKLVMRLQPYIEVKNRKLQVQVWLTIENLTDITREIAGKKVGLNKGKVDVTIDAFVVENMRGDWEAKPQFVLIKTLMNKFVFTQKSTDYKGRVKADAMELRDEIASFLKLNKFLF